MDNEQFRHAVSLFNRQEFFACHDVLEEIWSETLGEQREFLQGLIHAAVALFHFGEGNLGGARKMHDSTVRYLTPYLPECSGLDLATFLADFEVCFEPILGSHDSYPQGAEMNPELCPKLEFVE
ncbi:DUF309 domain-containing protein [Thalassoglobus sp. JC818]|uniref:DUF309 domain-containing protein n=1 Tax=Thalassoglobus sp. JC818 TaxID=3232136 RepID=UPI00345B4756